MLHPNLSCQKKYNISHKTQHKKSIQSAIIQTMTFSFEERWSEDDVKK